MRSPSSVYCCGMYIETEEYRDRVCCCPHDGQAIRSYPEIRVILGFLSSASELYIGHMAHAPLGGQWRHVSTDNQALRLATCPVINTEGMLCTHT